MGIPFTEAEDTITRSAPISDVDYLQDTKRGRCVFEIEEGKKNETFVVAFGDGGIWKIDIISDWNRVYVDTSEGPDIVES